MRRSHRNLRKGSLKYKFGTVLKIVGIHLSRRTSEEGAEVDEVAEAGPVPHKVELSGADDFGAVAAAAAVEDGLLVEDSARCQRYNAGLRMLNFS